jgi:hypothetical protein
MTMPAASRDGRVVGLLATAVLAGAAFRLIVSIAAGIAEWAQFGTDAFSRFPDRAADLLLVFGEAGDGVGVLLAVAALALVWWHGRAGAEVSYPSLELVRALFALTALAAVLQAVGWGIGFSRGWPVVWSRLIEAVGMSTAYAAVAVGGVVAATALMRAVDPVLVDHDLDAVVFAVDRATGDVRAYFSVDQAARKTHVYSVEDDELLFFTDEGDVLEPSVEHERVLLRPTGEHRREDLLTRLKTFSTRRGLHVDMLDVDDPSAYAVPVSDWQFLQLWPGWLRWLGRLFRPR